MQTPKQALAAFLETLEHHPVFKNPYFNFLQHSRWDSESYAIHRANFFYRTELTVKAIAHLCARAAAEEDQATLIFFSYILNEECGNGNAAHCHARLMEQSHNLFGAVEFALPALQLKDARHSPLIIPETLLYREKMQALLTSSYPCLLGAVMALETHAEKMLRFCRTAFQSSRQFLDIREYQKKAEIYFNCHLENGVEERHAETARECVLNNCANEQDFNEIRYGAEEALKVQLQLWNALYKNINQNYLVKNQTFM